MGCTASNDHVDAVMKDDLLQWTVIATAARVPPRDQFAPQPASRSDIDLMSAGGDSPVQLSLNPFKGTGSCEPNESTPDNSMFGKQDESRSMSAYLTRTALKAAMKSDVSQRAGSIENWLASVSVTGEAQEDVPLRRSTATETVGAISAQTTKTHELPSFPQSPAAE